MSEEQLKAFLEAVQADAGLQEKLRDAADLEAAVVIAKEAGFDVGIADWLEYQASQNLELSDEELEEAAGGWTVPAYSRGGCPMPGSWDCNADVPRVPPATSKWKIIMTPYGVPSLQCI